MTLIAVAHCNVIVILNTCGEKNAKNVILVMNQLCSIKINSDVHIECPFFPFVPLP